MCSAVRNSRNVVKNNFVPSAVVIKIREQSIFSIVSA